MKDRLTDKADCIKYVLMVRDIFAKTNLQSVLNSNRENHVTNMQFYVDDIQKDPENRIALKLDFTLKPLNFGLNFVIKTTQCCNVKNVHILNF